MTAHQHVAPSVAVAAPPAEAPAAPRRGVARSAGLPAWAIDAALWALVVGLGAVVRWPNLWLVPTFTDETGEALRAMAIYRGEIAPLTNVDGYIGALWNWALAVGWWAFGLDPWLPRLYAFVAGVLTVGAACWLGREVGGRVGGVVAGSFMAACSTHVLVNSHVGWSHATTPLFATLGLAALARATRSRTDAATGRAPVPPSAARAPGQGESAARAPGQDGRGARHASAALARPGRPTDGGGRWLVAAGALLGLAVQTHITAALLLPGASLALLLARPDLVRTRSAALAALGFLLVTANLSIYNVQTGGGSLAAGQAKLAGYTGEEDGFDPGGYVENVGRLVLATSWVLSGAIEKRRFVNETLAHPTLLLYLGAAVGGLAWAAWRGRRLPILVALPYLLVLPLLNPKFEPMLNGRYLTPVLPLAFAAIGLVAADAWDWGRARRSSLGAPLGLLALLAAGALALYPLLPMQRYLQSARTNHAILLAHETVLGHRQDGETVLLDYGLDGVFFMAAGSAFKSMELLLSGSGVPYVVIDARPASVEAALGDGVPRLAVLHSDKTRSLGRSFALTPLMPGGDGPGFGVYRVAPRR